MNCLPSIRYLCRCLLLLGGSIAAGSASAGTDTAALPAWHVLEFEQRAFWVTARSRIEVSRTGCDKQQWQMIATSSIAENTEQVQLTLDGENGRVLKRGRLSRGKEQRYKTYDYRKAGHILRERRDPGTDPALSPLEWAVSSSREIAYPVLEEGAVLTDAYALLLLADRFQAGTATEAEVVVHTDFNFYRVRMTRSTGIKLKVDYEVSGAGDVTGMRDTRAVTLHITPLGTLADKPDFSLMGLYGRITLLFDQESGLPVQLRGTAPQLGPAEINLKAVTLREPSA